MRKLEGKKFLFLFVSLLVSLPVCFPLFQVTASPAIGSTTATMYSVADAYINSSIPDGNYGDVDYLYARADSEQDYAYVMFDLSSIPSHANIISAKLMLYLTSIGGYVGDVNTYYCSDNSWAELEITWNNKPDFAPNATDEIYFGMFVWYNMYYSWNATADVRAALSQGKLTEVIVRKSSGHAVFHSREGANKPKLEVEYATKPVFTVHLESVEEIAAIANLGLITLDGSTFPLPKDIDVVNGSYAVSYTGGYTFVRWETTGGITVSDENAASTTVTVLGNGSLRAVGSVKKLEYAYDYGNPQYAYSKEAGYIAAVRFTPLFSGRLLTARYYMYDISSYQSNTFKVHVMDQDYKDLIIPFNATPTSKGWFDVDLSSYNLGVNEGRDFYIEMEWTIDYNPDLGKDETHPSNRSWYVIGTVWKQETYSDFVIRAIVGREPLLPTFNVSLLRNRVALDGLIIGKEWGDANRMNVTFERDGLTYEGAIYLKHDCNTLWMCIQVHDDDEELSGPEVMGDAVGVIFDANGNMKTDAGDDMAGLFHDDQPKDMAYTANLPSPPVEDDTIGGVMNVEGASKWEAGVYTFELSKPLNSGDSAGNDIALSPGKEIAVMFIYIDPDETVEAPPFVGFMLSLEPYQPPIINVGVKAGDWAAYGDISFEWASNVTGYEEPPAQVNMSWSISEILGVHNNNVTVQSTAIYKNGTEETYADWGDVATGEGNLSIGLIPSNLSVGDEIPANLTWYTAEPLKLFINGTVTRSYAGASREVNYVNITYPIRYGNITYDAWNMSFYWDKKTGIMCEEVVSYEMSYTVNMAHYYMNMSMTFRMTATNMWPAIFTAHDGYSFNVAMTSNSTISNFNFNEAQKQISFNVTGPTGKAGCCNVTIPKDLLRGEPWTILLNSTEWTTLCSITGNDTHTFIHIPYTCSTNTVQIVGAWVIPEFPHVILLLFMVFSIIALILAKKTHRKSFHA